MWPDGIEPPYTSYTATRIERRCFAFAGGADVVTPMLMPFDFAMSVTSFVVAGVAAM